jgi:hypothetical protein
MKEKNLKEASDSKYNRYQLESLTVLRVQAKSFKV